jgi:hypothetical protein
LERQFDPAVADLYSNNAVIRIKRTYPTGQVREVTLPASQYKALITKAMPLARLRGDTSQYSDCSYGLEGQRSAHQLQTLLGAEEVRQPDLALGWFHTVGDLADARGAW